MHSEMYSISLTVNMLGFCISSNSQTILCVRTRSDLHAVLARDFQALVLADGRGVGATVLRE
jgi:hypothetical protein